MNIQRRAEAEGVPSCCGGKQPRVLRIWTLSPRAELDTMGRTRGTFPWRGQRWLGSGNWGRSVFWKIAVPALRPAVSVLLLEGLSRLLTSLGGEPAVSLLVLDPDRGINDDDNHS